MDHRVKYDYYYGVEAEQFSFYRVPRILIKDPRFKGLSSDAKLLYGLMLDRMSLSLKNGWFDQENRAYIYYTMDHIMEDLGCAREKCGKILAELDSKKGIGLIEKQRQGLGKPDKIYVKNFLVTDCAYEKTPEIPGNSTEVRKSNFQKFENQTSRSSEIELPEDRKSNFQKFGNRISRSSKTELAEVRFPNPNDTEKSNNKISQSDSIHPSDWKEDWEVDVEQIKKNIAYDAHMKSDKREDRELYEELFQIICEVVCVERKTVRIGGEEFPYGLVKSRYMNLKSEHLIKVI